MAIPVAKARKFQFHPFTLKSVALRNCAAMDAALQQAVSPAYAEGSRRR
jgi:hypothetical protein